MRTRVDDREDALQQIKLEVNQLGNVPFLANEKTGGNAERAGKQLRAGKRAILDGLADLRRDDPPAPLARVSRPLAASSPGSTGSTRSARQARTTGRRPTGWPPPARLSARSPRKQLDAANRIYDQRAQRAIRQAGIGTAIAILLLLAAFTFFYRPATPSCSPSPARRR